MTFHRVRVAPMDISAVIGGDDPADTALLYGRLSAAMYARCRCCRSWCICRTRISTWSRSCGEETRGFQEKWACPFLIWDRAVIGFACGVPLIHWLLRLRKQPPKAENDIKTQSGKDEQYGKQGKDQPQRNDGDLHEQGREMVSSDTVISQPITTPDGVTLVPVSRLSFGFTCGGSDFGKQVDGKNFAGGTASAVKVDPVAFLVVKDGVTRVMPVAIPAMGTADRIIEMVPQGHGPGGSFLDKKKGNYRILTAYTVTINCKKVMGIEICAGDCRRAGGIAAADTAGVGAWTCLPRRRCSWIAIRGRSSTRRMLTNGCGLPAPPKSLRPWWCWRSAGCGREVTVMQRHMAEAPPCI